LGFSHQKGIWVISSSSERKEGLGSPLPASWKCVAEEEAENPESEGSLKEKGREEKRREEQ
jgi:hypothetical protein